MRELSSTEIECVNGGGVITDAIWNAVYAAVDFPSRSAGKLIGEKIGSAIGSIIAAPISWIHSLCNK